MVDYKKSCKQLALDMINSSAGTTLRTGDVDFKDVVYLDEGIYNTQITLTPAVISEWQEPITLQYDRLNIAQLFKGIPVKFKPNYQKTVGDFLPLVNEIYGLSLSVDDIMDGVIPDGINPPYTLHVKIREDNPAFYGEFHITVTDEDKSLRGLLSNLALPGITTPFGNTDKILGPLYLSGIDFSDNSASLSGYNADDVVDDHLTEIINLYSDDEWLSISSELPFNLYNAKVIYNSALDENNQYSKQRYFNRLLVIQLDETYCNNVSGYLTLHYNLESSVMDYTVQ